MRRIAAVTVLLGLMLVGAHAASAQEQPAYAPLDQPGQPLRVPPELLDASLVCTGALDGAKPAILLVHGTNLDYESNFGWTYHRQLSALGLPHCGVNLPHKGMDDVQVSAEYVVHAIRTLAARTGRPVQVVGFSQGGMIGRWALRWWPDTRPLVEEVIALAPSNHGTYTAVASCSQSCPPSHYQQRADSQFTAALNSRTETFDGIDYTVVFTRYDWVVTPNADHGASSSSLQGGANVANVLVQDVCPNSTAEHLQLGSFDPVGYALVHDALTHDGPASAERIDPLAVCGQQTMPGVEQSQFFANWARTMQVVSDAFNEVPPVSEEPPLACYVTASCAAPQGDAPEPGAGAPAGAGLPATGGGLAALGVAAWGAAAVLRRPRG